MPKLTKSEHIPSKFYQEIEQFRYIYCGRFTYNAEDDEDDDEITT